MAEAWAFIRSEGIGRQMDRWVDGQGGSWSGPGQVVGIPLAEALGTAGSPLTVGSLSHASLSDGMPVRPSPPRVSVLFTGFRKGVTCFVGLVYLINKTFSTFILCVSFCACVLLHAGTGCEFKTQGTLATPFVGVTWRAGLGAKNSGTLQVGPNTCFPEPLFLCNSMLVLTEAALCEPSSSPPLHAAACRLVT